MISDYNDLRYGNQPNCSFRKKNWLNHYILFYFSPLLVYFYNIGSLIFIPWESSVMRYRIVLIFIMLFFCDKYKDFEQFYLLFFVLCFGISWWTLRFSINLLFKPKKGVWNFFSEGIFWGHAWGHYSSLSKTKAAVLHQSI